MEIIKYRKDINSEWQTLAAIKGEKGDQGIQGETGPQGEPGADYVLTDADKTEIVNLVIAALPDGEEVSY